MLTAAVNMLFFKLIILLSLVIQIEMLRLIHEYAKLTEGKSVCADKLNITGFDFHKYNRTTKALSVNFTLLEDVTNDNDLETERFKVGVIPFKVLLGLNGKANGLKNCSLKSLNGPISKEIDGRRIVFANLYLNCIYIHKSDFTHRHFKSKIKTTLYLWKNNDYKKTPFMWSMQTCKFLDNNNFGIQLLMKDSTTQKCPLLKGKHYIRNVSPPDLQGWPSVIPEGKWKLNIEYYKQKQYCFTVEWFAIISKN